MCSRGYSPEVDFASISTTTQGDDHDDGSASAHRSLAVPDSVLGREVLASAKRVVSPIALSGQRRTADAVQLMQGAAAGRDEFGVADRRTANAM